jgi:hypothetical protein
VTAAGIGTDKPFLDLTVSRNRLSKNVPNADRIGCFQWEDYSKVIAVNVRVAVPGTSTIGPLTSA